MPDAVALAPTQTFVAPVVSLSVSAARAFGRHLGAFIMVGVDGQLSARRFELMTPAGRMVVLRPYRVEPWLGAGVAWR